MHTTFGSVEFCGTVVWNWVLDSETVVVGPCFFNPLVLFIYISFDGSILYVLGNRIDIVFEVVFLVIVFLLILSFRIYYPSLISMDISLSLVLCIH